MGNTFIGEIPMKAKSEGERIGRENIWKYSDGKIPMKGKGKRKII